MLTGKNVSWKKKQHFEDENLKNEPHQNFTGF